MKNTLIQRNPNLTYSLIARCPDSGQIGAITATKFLSAGAFMMLAEPSVGICVSQGFLNPLLRHQILGDLKNKIDLDTAVKKRVYSDSFPVLRQIIAMDWSGKTAVHSGHGCIEVIHDIQGPGIVAAGNMLPSKRVIDLMVESFCSAKGTLAEKLLIALCGGHKAGGDLRGARSTALAVYDNEPYPVVDLRVDDSDKPIEEMQRLAALYFNEYASVTRRLPNTQNPAGVLGPYPRARLLQLAAELKLRKETVPEFAKD